MNENLERANGCPRTDSGFQQNEQWVSAEWAVDSSRMDSLLAVNYISGTNDTELL